MTVPPNDPYADDPTPSSPSPAPGRGNPFTMAAPTEATTPSNPFALPPPGNGNGYGQPAPSAGTAVYGSGARTTSPPVVPQQPPARDTQPPSSYQITIPSVPADPPPGLPTRPMSEPAPLPIPGRGAAREDSTVRIGMWGSGRSGKSTYLASLPLAAMQGRHGTWLVAGTDEEAARYLNESVHRLAIERGFPRANRVIEPISWSFHGTPPPSGFGSFLRRSGLAGRRNANSAVEFTLELFDPPGSFYATGRVDETALDHLANANGLIYLMDPVIDAAVGEVSFQYFYGALQMLTSRLASTGQLVNGKLPHSVAVCITKFDDPTFFRHLVGSTGLVTQDPDGHRLPRVPQERAREFFDWVCARVLGGGAGMVQEALRAYFHEDKIEYFATSSIGFRLNQNQIFDFRDFTNVAERPDGMVMIRDRPRPINVLEPLIFLERRIRADRR
ncbi:hypothetical protein ACFO1B_52780 [Dactylosporangium siamense]|uniref:Uncharacterized protein n=1 Tax=Dactylosporangium siamense TaxID=685454 RepID=A0A919UHB6_9ACTN|nr:hypothetical protein [Dactylosporangium siamense]GIG50533.1 hypothetical protein Dsi01nite_085740 [Dactylosporangium siamense]